MSNEQLTFEESLAKLEAASEKLRRPDVPLQEAIQSYKEGLKHYETCKTILDDAVQEIETLTK